MAEKKKLKEASKARKLLGVQAKEERETPWVEAKQTSLCQSRIQSAESTASGSATLGAWPAACHAMSTDRQSETISWESELLVVGAAEVQIDRPQQAM